MFSLNTLSPAYYAPSKIDLLDGDGALVMHTFDLRFKRVTQAEAEAIRSEAESGSLSYEALFDRVLLGWRGVKDADDSDLPYTPQNLARVLQVRGMRQAISKAFFDSLTPTASAGMLTTAQ